MSKYNITCNSINNNKVNFVNLTSNSCSKRIERCPEQLPYNNGLLYKAIRHNMNKKHVNKLRA